MVRGENSLTTDCTDFHGLGLNFVNVFWFWGWDFGYGLVEIVAKSLMINAGKRKSKKSAFFEKKACYIFVHAVCLITIMKIPIYTTTFIQHSASSAVFADIFSGRDPP